MRHLRGIQSLIRILPFGSRWSARLRRHLELCRKCQEGMASVEDARTATIPKEKIEIAIDFWPALRRRLEREKPGKQARPRMSWRWALGAAGFLAAAAIGLFLLRPGEKNDPASGIKLRINYVKMYEEPAQAFIFHTQDVNSTFVWVEKQNSGETL
ncbi:MAG: hypothetical protein OEW18_08625 [Candidatus Aminicenantes bacterium]|nr:hypothetical protein [Candidatus Aminicenantes bacterium]